MENGYSMDYGDAYMEQEEEWEREGLLDPAWEKQQKKVSVFFYCFFSIFRTFISLTSLFFRLYIFCKIKLKIFFYFA